MWVSPYTIIAAGHGCTPLTYKVGEDDGQITFVTKLEKEKDNTATKSLSAKAFFVGRDKRGTESTDTKINTTHQNQISCIMIQSGNKDEADKISTSDGNGKVVVWDLRALERQIDGLSIQ